jgi:hypothetical protein
VSRFALVVLLLAGRQESPVAPRDERPATVADFTLDILPVLTRSGCNAGGCHGAAKGQNGFKLSLLGYDADADHEAVALEFRSRRINRAAPDESLLLLKASMKLNHKGGRLLKPGSPDFTLLRDWIKAGAPRRTRDATLTAVTVTPAADVLAKGAERQLTVEARYSDGTTRDVTRHALFSTNDDSIAAVDSDGLVRLHREGETAVIVRYGGFVVPATVGAGFGKTVDFAAANLIDTHLAAKWKSLGIAPAAPAGDAVLRRRMFLDVIGTLPTPDELRLDRAKLVDTLLARPEFETFWTLKLSQMLAVGNHKFPPAYFDWIRANLDKPLPETVRALVTSTGNAPPAAFFSVESDPRTMMEFTIQSFHGFRMQCANCHNHPLERFPQDDYHALAAVYARVRHENGVTVIPRGEIVNPRTGKTAAPRFDADDRRVPFADWLVSDRAFARAWANRLWAEIFGRGLVHPVDDLRASNPASLPALLEALTDVLAKEPRIKPFLRLLLTSNAYALSCHGDSDERWFARAIVKPLPAEVALDAVHIAAGTLGDRAIARFDPTATTPLLTALGRCRRETACTLRPEFGGSLRQALALVCLDLKAPSKDVDELFLRTIGRAPTAAERELAASGDPDDLFWALIASKEFQFRH